MLSPAIYNQLLSQFSLTDSTKDRQEEFLTTIESLASYVSVNCILKHLSPEQIDTFLNLTTTDPTGQKAFDFAREVVPTIEQEIAIELQKELATIKA